MIQYKVDASNLLKGFEGARERFLEGLEAGLKEAAKEIEEAARENAPDRTGELRTSIQSEIEMSGNKGTAQVYSDSQYAIYVHEGTGIHSRTGRGRTDVPWTYLDDRTGQYVRTSGMEATPFLEDAVSEKRPLVTQIIREEIEKRLGR